MRIKVGSPILAKTLKPKKRPENGGSKMRGKLSRSRLKCNSSGASPVIIESSSF